MGSLRYLPGSARFICIDKVWRDIPKFVWRVHKWGSFSNSLSLHCDSSVLPPVPPSPAGSSQCWEPQRQTAQCCQPDLQQGLLEISGAFALLQGAPRDEDFAALWCRAGCVGLCSSGIFFVQVVCAVCVSLGTARAWQVPLHRALASPKQPLSSSVGLGCQLLLLSPSLLRKPH